MESQGEVMRLLGQIEGKLESIEKTQSDQGDMIKDMNERLQTEEIKSAKGGAWSGGIVSTFIVILTETIKGLGR